jgi:hypothetical protein
MAALTPADPPLIDAENLFREPEPPQSARIAMSRSQVHRLIRQVVDHHMIEWTL